MATFSTGSPRKVQSRSNLLPPPDPANIKLPESPDKTNRLRAAKSHAQLSSTQSSLRQPRNGLVGKPSREQLNPLPAITTHSIPSRTRANSDAPMPFQRQTNARRPITSAAAPSSTFSSHSRKSSLELTFKDGPPPGTSPSESLSLLRHSILTTGVSATKEGMSDYRIYLWLALLNITPMSTDDYLSIIQRGRSPSYEKIANDVFRTLATDALFKRRVTDASITRVLNATAWRIHDEQQSQTQSSPADSQPQFQNPYVQGINVLSAPLLYASRSEAQAYALLTSLLTAHIPSYISPTMSGVHAGLDLIDRVLAIREPHLASFLLETHKLPAKIYAFPSVLTLCACTPPLPEVLKTLGLPFRLWSSSQRHLCRRAVDSYETEIVRQSEPWQIIEEFSAIRCKGDYCVDIGYCEGFAGGGVC